MPRGNSPWERTTYPSLPHRGVSVVGNRAGSLVKSVIRPPGQSWTAGSAISGWKRQGWHQVSRESWTEAFSCKPLDESRGR